MISATMARPRPAPAEFVPFPRQNRSKTRSLCSRGIPGPRSAMLTLPLAYVLIVTSLPGAVWATAFSTRFLIASPIAYRFPLMTTGLSSPWKAIGFLLANDLGRYIAQVEPIGHVESNSIKSSYPEELIHKPVHARDIGLDLRNLSIFIDTIECRGDDRKGRAQFVGRIGRELPLEIKPLLEAVQRVINGGDERRDFARQIILGQAD